MDESAGLTFARGKAHFEDEIDRRGEKPVSERRIHICVLRETRNSHRYKHQFPWDDTFWPLLYKDILYKRPLI